MIAALLAAIYWTAMFGPLYLDNLNVKEAAEIGLSGYAEGADYMRMLTLRRINQQSVNTKPIGSHMEETEDGRVVEVPGLGLTDENVIVDYDEQKRFARITIRYQRTVRLKPTQSKSVVDFEVTKEKRF